MYHWGPGLVPAAGPCSFEVVWLICLSSDRLPDQPRAAHRR